MKIKIKNLRKYFALVLIVFLMVYNTVLPSLIYAQEVTPTDTPTPDASTTIDNNTTADTTSNNSANSGDNSISPTPTPTTDPSVTPTDTPTDTPTPTPTPDTQDALNALLPTPTPTPTVDPADPTLDTSDSATDSGQINQDDATGSADPTITNTGDVTNDINSNGNSGENTANSDGSTNGKGHSDSSIDTGDATSVTNNDNSLNTVNVNSNLIVQSVNIYLTQNADINLSDPITIAAQEIVNHPNDPTVNVLFTSINNYAYLTNDIFNSANTGGNSINTSGGSAQINTGDAYSLVSSINKVNFVEINSVVHLVTINIFGNLNGNIILPDLTTATANCSTCGVSLNINNDATVTNNVTSTANSGGNTLNANGGSISTGDATGEANVLNLVNTNVLGSTDALLFINVYGTWNGSFIGWGDFSPQAGGTSLAFATTIPSDATGGTDCGCVGDLSINNNAIVINNITSTANTGDNTINGGRSSIQTGQAFSLVSLFNLVNTNFINSFGFFGFINIFGNWTGNIGGQSEFGLNSNSNNNDGSSADSADNSGSDNSTANSDVMEQGGLLSATNTNNVGKFVYPGDTVTFFVTAKNTGTGKVYGVKAYLYLIYNGENVRGTTFDLGDIDAGKGKKLTTGFVLSNKALKGSYTARVELTGNVGPDNSQVTASADSFFNVFVNPAFASDNIHNKINPAVLGSNYPAAAIKDTAPSKDLALYALLGTVLSYLILRGIRQRKTLTDIFTKNVSFKEKVFALRMFLL